jgi:hypothetical protein
MLLENDDAPSILLQTFRSAGKSIQSVLELYQVSFVQNIPDLSGKPSSQGSYEIGNAITDRIAQAAVCENPVSCIKSTSEIPSESVESVPGRQMFASRSESSSKQSQECERIADVLFQKFDDLALSGVTETNERRMQNDPFSTVSSA